MELLNSKGIIKSFKRGFRGGDISDFNNNFITNARISISSFVEELSKIGFEMYKISKSPMSNSIYLDFYFANESEYCCTFQIRFSDHHCCNVSNSLVMYLIDKNGHFTPSKTLLHRIQINAEKNLSKYIKRLSEYEN